MSVYRTATTQNFVCLSSDTKPTTGVVAGSLCREVDTGAEFIYNGSDWFSTGAVRGNRYTASHSVSVGTGTAVTVLFTAATTTTCYTRLCYSIESSNAITGTFSETPNASNGTAIAAYNTCRAITASANASIEHTCASYQSVGSVLVNHAVGGTAGIFNGGSRQEWTLATSGEYLWRFAAANAATTVNLNIFWEEAS